MLDLLLLNQKQIEEKFKNTMLKGFNSDYTIIVPNSSRGVVDNVDLIFSFVGNGEMIVAVQRLKTGGMSFLEEKRLVKKVEEYVISESEIFESVHISHSTSKGFIDIIYVRKWWLDGIKKLE